MKCQNWRVKYFLNSFSQNLKHFFFNFYVNLSEKANHYYIIEKKKYTNKPRLSYIILDKEDDDVYSLHRTCLGPMLRLQGILHSILKQTKHSVRCVVNNDLNYIYLYDNYIILIKLTQWFYQGIIGLYLYNRFLIYMYYTYQR